MSTRPLAKFPVHSQSRSLNNHMQFLQSETVERQRQCRKAVSQEKRQHTVDEAEHLLNKVPDQLARMVNMAAEHPTG